MLHATLRRGQVRHAVVTLLLLIALGILWPGTASLHAQSSDPVEAQAAQLAQAGRHLEAAGTAVEDGHPGHPVDVAVGHHSARDAREPRDPVDDVHGQLGAARSRRGKRTRAMPMARPMKICVVSPGRRLREGARGVDGAAMG